MQGKEFNLLDEPWIKVLTLSLEQKEVSLIDVIAHAHEYVNLSGEMALQDVAILRVILAAVETIFYRFNVDGEEDELSEENDSSAEDVLERWKDYWERGSFSEQVVKEYFHFYHERFFLFHPDVPFWQVSDLQYGTDYGIECLYGNMKESMNKATKHHFSMVDGEEINCLSYAEAARWLIYLNAYAVNLKTSKEAPGATLPVGTGRLGQLGLVMVNEKNLFRLLMINLCPLKNKTELWGCPKPTWEKEVCREQSREIAPPDNLPELYTIQSRRLMLKRDVSGRLVGFRALGGDFYSVENDFNEQMTLWKEDVKTNEKRSFQPQRHDPAVHAWREFPALFYGDKEGRTPGIVQWLNVLSNQKILELTSVVTFRMLGIVYGDKMNYTYGDCVDDALMMSAGLLNDLGKIWITRISDEIAKCQKVAFEALSRFAKKIFKLLSGNSSSQNGIKSRLIENYYFLVDIAFRDWLASINPRENNYEDKVDEWEKQSYFCAEKVARDYVLALGAKVYSYKKEDQKLLVIPKVLNEYLSELNMIYKKTK